MNVIRQAGFFALLTLTIDFVPLLMAIAYAVRPGEQRLALMRPLSLAGLFSGLAGGVVGTINAHRAYGMAAAMDVEVQRRFAIGFAEALVPVFVSFACLTVAWLLVAVGMQRRQPD